MEVQLRVRVDRRHLCVVHTHRHTGPAAIWTLSNHLTDREKKKKIVPCRLFDAQKYVFTRRKSFFLVEEMKKTETRIIIIHLNRAHLRCRCGCYDGMWKQNGLEAFVHTTICQSLTHQCEVAVPSVHNNHIGDSRFSIDKVLDSITYLFPLHWYRQIDRHGHSVR